MPSDITPTELAEAAAGVARAQVALADAALLLADRLDAVPAPAGDDAAGRSVGQVYEPAARAGFAGLAAVLRVLDGAVTALITTGENYLRAEQRSRPGTPAPHALPRPTTAGAAPRTPAAATGPGTPSPLDVLTRWWPTADPDRLLDVTSSWAAAADSVDSAAAALDGVVAALVSRTSGPDVDAMVEFWAGLLGPDALVAEAAALSRQVATLCRR